MRYYTKADMEKRLASSEVKRVLLLRNGGFVGLYRYDKASSYLRLWKSINKDLYGKRTAFRVSSRGAFWGYGGTNGVSALVERNELHFIPVACRVAGKSNCDKLDALLGGCHSEVQERLRDLPNQPPEMKGDL